MKRALCSLWSMALLASFATWAAGKESKASKEPPKSGGVNWDGQVLKASGQGAPDMRSSSPAQARLGAERAAQLDAFRNLLEQVKGVQVTAGKTVGDAMGAKDEVRGKVEGAIKAFKITGKHYFSDNGVQIDVEVPLAAVAELLEAPAEDKIVLHTEGAAKNTGLVVDARGLGAKPALAPRLLDGAGKALYDSDCLSQEARKSSITASYLKSVEEAKKSQRVGDRPLVVKAQKASGSDLVLADEDAKRLSESNNGYLAEGRVVIVTN